MQSLAENGSDVEVHDHEILFKLLAARDEVSVLVQDHAIPVKNKLVLSTDQIVVRHDNGVVARARGKHVLAPSAFAGMIRR